MYPVLFKLNLSFMGLGEFAVRTYSVLLLLAFVAAIIVLRNIVKRRTLVDPSVVIDLAFWVIIGVVIGARLAYVFMHWSDFSGNPGAIFKIWEGGAVYFGGFILAFVMGLLYVWVKKIPVLPLVDSVAPVIALGEGIGRLGCFFNGCCFGKPTDVCGIVFPEHSFASAVFGTGQSIWPTQLFQAAGGILLFVILILLMNFVRLRKGQLFGLSFIGFGALRFGVNFMRYYENDLNLWTNQWIAIGLAALGIALFVVFGLTQEKVPSLEWIASERKRMAEAERKREEKEKGKKKHPQRKSKSSKR